MQTTQPRVLPDLDPEVGQQLGDEILLSAAAQEKPVRVAGRTGAFLQSHTARAWTRGGNVD